jgi:hypothetical protein
MDCGPIHTSIYIKNDPVTSQIFYSFKPVWIGSNGLDFLNCDEFDKKIIGPTIREIPNYDNNDLIMSS